MASILTQMGLLILCGVGWRIIKPAGLPADQTRLVLTTLVFNVLMPALVVAVLWKTPVSEETLRISAYGVSIIAIGLGLTWLMSRVLPLNGPRLGAALLTVAYPNVTYLGLPVLEQAFGPWSRAIVIQIDLFASMPAMLVFGAMLSQHYGTRHIGNQSGAVMRSLVFNPPAWAAVIGIALNRFGVAQPIWLGQTLERMAGAVIPLMLLAVGMGLNLGSLHPRNVPWALLAIAIRLIAVPWIAIRVGMALGFLGDTLSALVLEAAMPSMLFGVLFCDRYGLDTGFYAMVVAVTMLAGAVTLPFWHQLVIHL